MNLPKLSLGKGKLPGYGARLRPARDWLVLLILVALLLLISVGWNLWYFRNITRGGEAVEPTPALTGSAEFEKVRALFDARKAEEERYRNEYRFVDPSR